MDPERVSLFCPEVLQSLQEFLGGEKSLCSHFVLLYIDMWPGRFKRIYDAVKAGHREDAMDAALSLRTASAMVGAQRLSELTTEIIHLLDSGKPTAAIKTLETLQLCGTQTMTKLKIAYLTLDHSK
ncbi:Hpt domain-containing protein (plasmid) [Arthrobacter sp. TMP15]|uniref:Hpt domain-containing protein n=1 Tax=Arthrobacter sp. TMP15 TaxID=3140789 RepID=UPI0031BABD65